MTSRSFTAILVLIGVVAAAPASFAQKAPAPTDAEAQITKLPRVSRFVEAIYPANALADRIEARVVLELDIDAEGMVESANVVDSAARRESGLPLADPAAYGFDQAATIAASQLEFEPAEAEGTPIPVRIRYTYNFALPREKPRATAIPTAVPSAPTAEQPQPAPLLNFKGRLLERGTRARLAGVSVTVFRGEGDAAEGFEAVSDAAGNFELFDLAADKWQVLVEADGYYRYETAETITRDEQVDATYYLERRSYNPYDVLVEGERPKKEVNRRSLTSADIVKVPGTLGDPVQVIENLPGVARSAPFSGEIIVRGSGPYDTGIFLDGASVPLIYHFGGLRAVVPANVVDSVDFYPGNYSVAYGRAMGGIFDLNIKRLDPDRVHGSIDVSLLDSALYLEAPLGDDAAIAVAARRSYIDAVLNLAVSDDSSVGMVTAPRYYDYQILANWRPLPAHELRAMFFGSDDRMELLFKEPADLSPQLETGGIDGKTGFQRLNLEHRYTPSKRFRNQMRLSVGRDKVDFHIFQYRSLVDIKQASLRDTATWTLADWATLEVGADVNLQAWTGEVLSARPPEEGDATDYVDFDDAAYTSFDNRLFFYAAPFVEGQLELGRLTLVPGLRADYFSRIEAYSADPRIVARYDLGKWTAKAGAAVVHQEPTGQQTDDVFGNPDLGLQRANQYSLGLEWRPRDHLKLDLTGFYKQLDDLVSPVNDTVERDGERVAQVYDNGGKGRVYGLEVFAEHKLSSNLRGWLTYSLSRAERTDSGTDQRRLFDHDQTHIFAVVGSYLLPRNWELGLRWRYVTGSPVTPIVGSVLVSDDDEYAPVPGATNSERLEAFHQLDLRVDKAWLFKTWRLSTYLSLTNAYNRENIEAVSHNYDYSEKGGVSGLPLMPIVGVRADF